MKRWEICEGSVKIGIRGRILMNPATEFTPLVGVFGVSEGLQEGD